jgi:hypothetical protein
LIVKVGKITTDTVLPERRVNIPGSRIYQY